jgi:hypothetical protein
VTCGGGARVERERVKGRGGPGMHSVQGSGIHFKIKIIKCTLLLIE